MHLVDHKTRQTASTNHKSENSILLVKQLSWPSQRSLQKLLSMIYVYDLLPIGLLFLRLNSKYSSTSHLRIHQSPTAARILLWIYHFLINACSWTRHVFCSTSIYLLLSHHNHRYCSNRGYVGTELDFNGMGICNSTKIYFVFIPCVLSLLQFVICSFIKFGFVTNNLSLRLIYNKVLAFGMADVLLLYSGTGHILQS